MTSIVYDPDQLEPDALDEPGELASEQAPTARTYGDPVKTPDLLTMAELQAARALVKRWESQDSGYSRLWADWSVNERRRAGESNIWVAKGQDQNTWEVYKPPGASKVPPAVFNKADRLCSRVTSQVYADQAVMEATPGETGSSDAKDKADLATRILVDTDSEGKLNDFEAHRTAFDLGHSFGSAYLVYDVDPRAGGRSSIQVEAGLAAQHIDEATHRTVPGLADPITGQPGPPTRVEWPELIARYVREDGTLTDNPAEAALRWMPQLTNQVLAAPHVRFWPPEVTRFQDADMILVADFVSWSFVARRYPELDLSDEEKGKLSSERPRRLSTDAKGNLLLPRINGKPRESSGADLDAKLVFRLRAWSKECANYPDGLELCILGTSRVVSRGPWMRTPDAADEEHKDAREPLDIPVVQVLTLHGERGNPHGLGLMSILGLASEWRTEIVGAIEDLLDQIINRKTFVPINSTYSGKEAALSYLKYIPINPGGQPFAEEIPVDALQPTTLLFQTATSEMDDASSLQQAGQGLETSDAQSGVAKRNVLGQVMAGLSDVRQHALQAFERAGRIKLQLIRAKYRVPQVLKYTGEAGDYKVKKWMGTDLVGVSDVRVQPGSFTMMSPMQKANQVMQYAAIPGLIPQEDLKELLFSHVSADIGWRDNPHYLRIRKAIAAWLDGPPDDGQPPPQIGSKMLGPAMLQPDPRAAQLFAPRLVDYQPDVASMWLRELGRAMVDPKYEQFPAPWTMALDQAYQMRAEVLSPRPQVAVASPTGQSPQNSGAPPTGEQGPPTDQEGTSPVAAGAV